MEKDIEVIYETNEFVVDKVVELNSRIYDHHLDYTNWHLALLDEKSGVSLINQNFENFCNFEKTHKDKINMIKCLEKHVVTVADDKTLKFWSKDTKKLEATLKFEKEVFSFAISKKILAVGQEEGVIEFCNLETGKRLGKIDDCHNDNIRCLNFSTFKPTVLLAGSDDGHLVLYDLANESLDEAMETMINLEYSISDCDFVNGISSGYAISNLKYLLVIDLETDAVLSKTSLYTGTEEFRQFLGVFRGVDDSVNYFLMRDSKYLEVRNIQGEIQALVQSEHSALCRGAGVFGKFFFTYGDDKKLVFYKEKEEVKKSLLSDVEKAQKEMVLEDNEELVMSRGGKLKIQGLSNSGSFNPFDLLNN